MRNYLVTLSDSMQHHMNEVTMLLAEMGCTSIHSPFPGTIHYRASLRGEELDELEKALSDRPYVRSFGER